MSRPLELLSFPLRGSHLIEASAGTGKTYTLAALYLRLVLGHGDDNSFHEPLLPPDILVVTFTEAATRELRDRIRQRLTDAARVFSGVDAEADPFLRALRDSVPPAQRGRQAARLRAAAQWMDDAAIYTIHGFCQRMLRQHAFDSGSLFTLELTPDEEQLLATATNDYWRTFCLALDQHQASWLAQTYSSPEQLLHALRPLLNSAGSLPRTEMPFAQLLDHWIKDYLQAIEDLKNRWREWTQQLLPLFEAAWEDGRLSKSKPSRSASIRGWLEKLLDWCNDPDDISKPAAITDASLNAFSRDPLQAAGKDIDALLMHPAIDRFNELANPAAQLPGLAPRLLPHACHWIAARLTQSKHQQALIGFDDMLRHLHNALSGAQGDALAQQIRRQYPFALIDEFQDTDPVQYGIFRQIYGDSSAQAGQTGWLMIGDPKQAIYSFRGADIHTYLAARRDTAGRHHTLTTNFRSRAPLVAAINSVFGQAQKRDGGAFMLGDEVPFLPVQAHGRDDTLIIDGQVATALTFWHLQKPGDDRDRSFTKGAYRDAMAKACAAHIADLLEQADQGRTGFRTGDTLQPLAPADIAILVRDRSEADAMREALQALNLPSVYLSDRDNVFAAPEARDLLTWLRACAEPRSEALVRLALASATLDQDWSRLHQLVSDETLWEDTAEQFIEYQQQWRQRGVLAMVRQILKAFDVPARLLAHDNGERRLTNLLHLGELLQQAASQLEGEQALIRWLADQIDAAVDGAGGNTAEEQILRLESDADLIKVITMHKSKGLEYPLVFIPFACAYRPANPDRPPLTYHDPQGKLVVDLAPDTQATRMADQERLAEDLRLIYVAMTRARHACWLGIAATRIGRRFNICELHRSGIGKLLGASADTTVDDVATLLSALEHDNIAVTDAPTATTASPRPARREAALSPARQFSGRADSHWWIASYSALRKAQAGDAPEDAGEDILREELRAPAPTPAAEGLSAHGFPRGPLPGTFLHELLEWGAEHGFARLHGGDQEWQQALATRCDTRRWNQWQPTLTQWLQQLTRTPIPLMGEAMTLAGLGQHQYQAEMEFWLPVNQVDVATLDHLVCAQTLKGVPRAPLEAAQLNGMLKGFIDLVFEHHGRFHVLDYKSNWLGPDDDSYHPDALQQAMIEGRYDMQACLYMLALHRLLRSRLGPAYDYDTHVGSSLYLFLRGIGHAGAGAFVERPDRALIEAMDELFREGSR